jgi:putative ABC transport system ATP-binding protein
MIELAKVSLHRGEAVILDGAFVQIDEGQVVLISGPSGIGKTSLLSLIGGFVTASEGEVRVFQHDVARMRATSTSLLRRKLAFVPQELELIDDLSALANVRLALEVCGYSRRESKRRAVDSLTAVDLGDFLSRRVSELSTGQRRRVSLARGMVRESDIFVADEPSNDLDACRVLQLVDLLEAKREDGTAIVLATNDPRVLAHAQQPGWRHLTLSCGQLVPGDAAALFAMPTSSEAEAPKKLRDDGGTVVPFPISAIGGAE